MFMGRTGWRHRVTGKHYRGEEIDGGPGPAWAPIIENVDLHDGEEHPYKLKVISLHQPFASLIFAKVKRHETRGWPWPAKMIGEQVGIHAAKTIQRVVRTELDPVCCDAFGANWRETLPAGAILGTCVPVLTGPTTGTPPESAEDVYAGDWDPGRWATRLRSRTRWAAPIPWRGQQGFWTITEDELNAAARELCL